MSDEKGRYLPRLVRNRHSAGPWAGCFIRWGRLAFGVSQPINGAGRLVGYTVSASWRRRDYGRPALRFSAEWSR